MRENAPKPDDHCENDDLLSITISDSQECIIFLPNTICPRKYEILLANRPLDLVSKQTLRTSDWNPDNLLSNLRPTSFVRQAVEEHSSDRELVDSWSRDDWKLALRVATDFENEKPKVWKELECWWREFFSQTICPSLIPLLEGKNVDV